MTSLYIIPAEERRSSIYYSLSSLTANQSFTPSRLPLLDIHAQPLDQAMPLYNDEIMDIVAVLSGRE